MKVSELLQQIEELAETKQWGLKPDTINVAEKFALIHTEVAEAFEAYRRGNLTDKDGVSEELADTIIRTLHLCLILGIDVEKEIQQKIARNHHRTWNHPNEVVTK